MFNFTKKIERLISKLAVYTLAILGWLLFFNSTYVNWNTKERAEMYANRYDSLKVLSDTLYNQNTRFEIRFYPLNIAS